MVSESGLINSANCLLILLNRFSVPALLLFLRSFIRLSAISLLPQCHLSNSLLLIPLIPHYLLLLLLRLDLILSYLLVINPSSYSTSGLVHFYPCPFLSLLDSRSFAFRVVAYNLLFLLWRLQVTFLCDTVHFFLFWLFLYNPLFACHILWLGYYQS